MGWHQFEKNYVELVRSADVGDVDNRNFGFSAKLVTHETQITTVFYLIWLYRQGTCRLNCTVA